MAQQQDLAHPTLADALWAPAAGSKVARSIALAVIGSILLTISAKIQVPFWPVPMTMQTLVVLVLGVTYGWRLAGATVLLYLALSGAVYFLPFNLIQVQGYSATQAGAAFLPFSVIMGLGSTYAGDLIRRFDARKVLTLGPLVVAAGFAALATSAFPAAGERYDSLAARDAIDWDGYAVIEMRRYRAALAWEAAGDQGRALAGYQAFLSAWPDADADLPAVADARRRIQGGTPASP